MLRPHLGHSITEYIIIVALVVLVAVPVLMFMGSGFHQNLDQVAMEQSRVNGGENNPASAKPGALTDGNDENPGWVDDDDHDRPVLEKDDMLVGNGWTAKYNEETGEMRYSVNESNDNGTNTASVQGGGTTALTARIKASPSMTKAIARQIQRISQMKDANGQSLPEDLQAKLVALGNIGINMGHTEKFLVKEYTQNGVTLINALAMDQKVRQLRAQHDQFSSAFSEIKRLLAANPDYKSIRSRFLGLTGMISYSADANFFNPAGQYVPDYAEVAVVGRKPKQVPSILETVGITTKSGRGIGSLTP